MSELEANISCARLKLLDKRKSVRETVHKHYRELIGVADHANRMNDMLESLVEGHARLGSLTRALRVKAATAQLSSDGRYGGSASPRRAVVTKSDEHEEEVFVLNARVLFLATRMEFSEISKIIKSGIHHSQPSESEAFGMGLESRVVSYCWRAVASPNLVSRSSFSPCVELLTSLASPEIVLTEFWRRRKTLILSTESVVDQVRLFDISMSMATVCQISPSDSFEIDLCGDDGVITNRLLAELGKLHIHSMFERFIAMKDAVAECRQETKRVGRMDILLLLETAVRRLSEQAVRSALADVSIDSLNLDALEKSLTGLSSELTQFEVWSSDDAEALLGRELDARLTQAVKDSDQTNPSTAVNACALAHAFSHNLRHLSSQNTSSIAALKQLAMDSFDLRFDQLVGDLFAGSHRFDFLPDQADVAAIFNFVTVDEVTVPSHLSPVAFDVSFGVCLELTRLASFCTESATLSAKAAIARFFSAHLSSLKHVSLQTLFDAASAAVLASAVEDNLDYDYLVNTVVPEIQRQVLPDQVDVLLYRDAVRTAAVAQLVRNLACFQPLLVANPSMTHLAPSGQTSITASGSILRSLANMGENCVDRFPILPVAKSVPHQAPVQTAPQPKRQSSNVVTSFFNQVGKITLGSNQR